MFNYEVRHEEVRDRRGTAKLQGFLTPEVAHPTPRPLLREGKEASIRYDACWAPNPSGFWMTEKSHLPVGIKTRFLFRAARSVPNENPTLVSQMTPVTYLNGTVHVIAGDETDTRILTSANLTNHQFVSALKCM